MLAKCPCQNCGAHIEFDAGQFEQSGATSHRRLGQTVDCPHCGKATQLYLNVADFIAPKLTREKSSIFHTRQFWFILIAVVLFAAFFFIMREFGEQAINVAGVVIPGALGIALLILGLYWLICLILLPIFVYQIYRTVIKIELNTRQTK